MPKLKLGLETLNKDIDTESEIEISRDITEIGALIFITTVVMHFCVKQFALWSDAYSAVSLNKNRLSCQDPINLKIALGMDLIRLSRPDEMFYGNLFQFLVSNQIKLFFIANQNRISKTNMVSY